MPTGSCFALAAPSHTFSHSLIEHSIHSKKFIISHTHHKETWTNFLVKKVRFMTLINSIFWYGKFTVDFFCSIPVKVRKRNTQISFSSENRWESSLSVCSELFPSTFVPVETHAFDPHTYRWPSGEEKFVHLSVAIFDFLSLVLCGFSFDQQFNCYIVWKE
jgi:hypothetical protein